MNRFRIRGILIFGLGLSTAVAVAGQRGDAHGLPVPLLIRALVPAQIQQEAEAEPAQTPEAKAGDDDKPTVVETVDNSQPINPREIRLHMWDGTVITGELGIEQVVVQTEFGELQIPVEKIISFRPGLNSFPQLRDRIDQLVADLGSDDYKTRETAHRQMVSMGLQLRREIYRFTDDGNAERKRHLEEIRKEIEAMVEDIDEDPELADESNVELIAGDSIATKDFVVVGKIVQDAFEISSKYGPLTVKLGDVQFADRQGGGGVERRLSVSITGKNFIHSNPKSTGIRVNRGDRITVRAEGQITMSPWGVQATSTPDGNNQYGNYNGHGGGTLLAIIGEDDKYIKIGSKATFTATKSGLLKLGIAIQPEYANENYQFPGTYKAKLVVESAEASE